MRVSWVYQGQAFEWDSDKALINERKHGISFELACEAFFDPFLRLLDAGTEGETRDAVLGFTSDSRLLFVVHLLRDRDLIRIVSARVATAQERKLYEEGE